MFDSKSNFQRSSRPLCDLHVQLVAWNHEWCIVFESGFFLARYDEDPSSLFEIKVGALSPGYPGPVSFSLMFVIKHVSLT